MRVPQLSPTHGHAQELFDFLDYVEPVQDQRNAWIHTLQFFVRLLLSEWNYEPTVRFLLLDAYVVNENVGDVLGRFVFRSRRVLDSRLSLSDLLGGETTLAHLL